jgi:hypothetical protein
VDLRNGGSGGPRAAEPAEPPTVRGSWDGRFAVETT